MNKKIRAMILAHENYIAFYACHRNCNEATLRELSCHFTDVMDIYTVPELSEKVYKKGSKVYEKIKAELSDEDTEGLDLEGVCKYRGTLLPYFNEDASQQTVVLFDGKYYSSGHWYEGSCNMLLPVNIELDKRIYNGDALKEKPEDAIIKEV